MNILVTGANGQLGQSIRAASIGSKHHFIFTDITKEPDITFLDITNLTAISALAESENVDVIVNCAAFTDVERAEQDASLAFAINTLAVKNLAIVSKERNSTLIHISTDYVYDGRKAAPYVETDLKNPVNMYAKTKYDGELEIQKIGCKCILFRTAWMFSNYGNNFLKTMIRLTREKEWLNVVYDQVGTPTYAPELALLIIKVIDENKLDLVGEYNFTNEGSLSWYDFAAAINRVCKHHCDIHPCRTEEYPSKVKRPSFSVLDKNLVKKTFGIKIPHWFDSLDKCLSEINKK